MRITRRSLLGVAALTLTGCAGAPTIQFPSVEPLPDAEQESWAAAATATVARLRDTLATATSSDWRDAGLALTEEQLLRLTSLDPFAEEPGAHFATPPAEEPATAPDQAVLVTAAEHALQELTDQALDAPGQPERLLLASASCAVASLRTPSLPPVPGGAPRRFAEVTLHDALPVALSHSWALIQGLELGLARLADEDELRDYAGNRLPQARQTRNRFRDLVDGDPPLQPPALAMPTPMNTPAEIRTGWAALELGLLDGYGRLAAMDVTWLTDMQAQVPRVQSLGGRLPHWPGWAG